LISLSASKTSASLRAQSGLPGRYDGQARNAAASVVAAAGPTLPSIDPAPGGTNFVDGATVTVSNPGIAVSYVAALSFVPVSWWPFAMTR
jgi:hypothetical protein